MRTSHTKSPPMETPLRRLRKARNLTADQVGAAVGCNGSQIIRAELGVAASVKLAAKLADYYGREFISELHILYPQRYMKA